MRTARNAGRHRRRLKVTLACGVSFTVDVSEGGFCTESMRVLAPGTLVKGTIEGPGKNVAFVGRVAWNVPGDAMLNMRGRMGIAFANGSPELLELLSPRSAAGKSRAVRSA